MCGFAGILPTRAEAPLEVLRQRLDQMTQTLVHRGPDDVGFWAAGPGRAGPLLGFRRLSIQDLSPQGHQPMHSASGRYTIVFNGEVYNFHDLRAQLPGHEYRGHSDTEIILHAVETWGVAATLERVVGMFAIALWDQRERMLHLVRDRAGEKPLYYGWLGDAFVFGSELKALRAYPGFPSALDPASLRAFLRYGYVPGPRSIYRDIWKLTPGSWLAVPADDPQGRPTPRAYWSARQAAEAGAVDPFEGSDEEACGQLDALLRQAVREQMVADVPLGAFLSGGIDSSTIVALMQAQASRPIRTFTIGFSEQRYNEAPYAKAVAEHLGTAHTELYVTPEQTLGIVPKLATLYDEPFADASQIPTCLVARLARQQVTVSLSGDGGDEFFGGYSWYFATRRIWDKIRWMPGPLRRAAGSALASLPTQSWDLLFKAFDPLVRPSRRVRAPGDRLHKLAAVLSTARSPASVHDALVSRWREPPALLTVAPEDEAVGASGAGGPVLDDPLAHLMWIDQTSYLPDNILTKVDRATMGVSLESRAPLLDHRVMEFAWRLPMSMKIRDGRGKYMLRQVLKRYVPDRLVDRPKMGFCVPIDDWLRGPLRSWADDLLSESRLRREGFLHPGPVRRKFEEHVSGQRNWQHHLWHVLMFESWLAAQ